MGILVTNWEKALSFAKLDERIGIKVAVLSEVNLMGSYVAEVPVSKSITPHYHDKGHEEYHIISGEGVIRLSPIDNRNKNFKFVCKKISAGNSFVIPPRTIHQLINTGNSPLLMIFNSPLSHLKNDRFITEGILNE
jgi:mannose-6-phosphate isomerase-like protein (cupin superfamily)